MIEVYEGTTKLLIKDWKFPAGEIGIKIPISTEDKQDIKYSIKAHIKSSDDLIKLLMVNDALKREHITKQYLHLYYVPYMQQDRVCEQGEALSSAVFASMINACGFKCVYIIEPHSDVITALLNNVSVIDIKPYILPHLNGDAIIVSPDAGALKRCQKIGDVYKNEVVCCTKHRSTKNGEILKYDSSAVPEGKHLFVYDDMCIGGATFIALGESLKNKAPLSTTLFVTHGIFSKGIDELVKYYDKIITTNSYHGSEIPDSLKTENVIWHKL